MNDEELKRALEALPPQDPRVDGWAPRARRRSHMRRGIATAAVLAVGLGVPAAYLANGWYGGLTHIPVAPEVLAQPSHSPVGLPASPAPDAAAPVSPAPTPVGMRELTGIVAIHSGDDGDGAQLCATDVASIEGLVPVCAGPVLKGDFSWNDVDYHEVDGQRWTDAAYRIFGAYDLNDGPSGSFTLSRPVEREAQYPEPEEQYPTDGDGTRSALCDSPILTKTGDPDQWVVGSWAFNDALDIAKSQRGYLAWWVDGKNDFLNIEVDPDTDIETLERRLGETWGGPICVGTTSGLDAETEEDIHRLFEESMQDQTIVRVASDREEPGVSVVLWGYDESLIDWFQTLDDPELQNSAHINLTLEFVLTPVGEVIDPVTIATR
ncbi:MAG TPA: hypothetical protein PKE40_05895 [Arachnia sp.]|nr:hypothetical protein [Arachnia sp.]HMT85868.1 hypothetical protein [Arachnia sp.]